MRKAQLKQEVTEKTLTELEHRISNLGEYINSYKTSQKQKDRYDELLDKVESFLETVKNTEPTDDSMFDEDYDSIWYDILELEESVSKTVEVQRYAKKPSGGTFKYYSE